MEGLDYRALYFLLEEQYDELKDWIEKAGDNIDPPDLDTILFRHKKERRDRFPL